MRSSKYLFYLFLVVAFLFLLTQAQPVKAQIPGMPKMYGEFKEPKVGEYVTYMVTNTKNNVKKMTKLGIVGKEKSEEGEDLFWYEVEETHPKTGNVSILKMLISGNPQNVGTIHRMISKSGKTKASELPQALIEMINQTPAEETEVVKPKIKELGTEKIKVEDQTLECKHLQYLFGEVSGADVWANDQVPLLGLVKSTTRDVTMELLEYGTDAVSAIQEEPEALEMPGLK